MYILDDEIYEEVTWDQLTTKERVEIMRKERSFTTRFEKAAIEIDDTLTKYFGKKWIALRNTIFALFIITVGSLNIN